MKKKITVSKRGECAGISIPATLAEEVGLAGWKGLKLEKVKGKKWELSEAATEADATNRLQSRKATSGTKNKKEKVYYYFYTTQFNIGDTLYIHVESNTKIITIKKG